MAFHLLSQTGVNGFDSMLERCRAVMSSSAQKWKILPIREISTARDNQIGARPRENPLKMDASRFLFMATSLLVISEAWC
jgi:hypothetical protein